MIKIGTVDELVWEHIPVMKIIKYSADEIKKPDFKPFAQAKICYQSGIGLAVQMIAFEVKFNNNVRYNHHDDLFNDSTLSFVISNKFQDVLQNGLIFTFNRNKNYVVHHIVDDKRRVIEEDMEVNCFDGEDLQGIYWGIEFSVKDNFLKKYINLNLKSQNEFYVNFIKSCFDEKFYHCGGYFDVKTSEKIGHQTNSWIKSVGLALKC